MLARLTKHLLRILLTLLLGGLLAATLIRYAPGFDTDEQQMDSRLSSESIEALRQQRAAQGNLFKFYGRFLSSAVRGDFGQSQTLNRSLAVRRNSPLLRRKATPCLAHFCKTAPRPSCS